MNIYKKLKIKKPTERKLGFFVNGLSILAIIGIILSMWRNGWHPDIELAFTYFGVIILCLIVGLWERCGIEVYRAFMVVPKGIGKLLTTISHKCIIKSTKNVVGKRDDTIFREVKKNN